MYIDVTNTLGRKPCYLLRECFRIDGKVKHATIANISHCPIEEIEALKLALEHKQNLAEIASIPEIISLHQGLSVGAIIVLESLANKIGLIEALGNSQKGKLALWQVMARILDQGSRLSATRLAGTHAICDLLNLKNFTEDDLYTNLDWLEKLQSKIEDALFHYRYSDQKPELFLYDVTSSYLEGKKNELAAFGYNRDGKKGKMQIVIGLLCDSLGEPLSVEVFEGNYNDPKTFGSQVRKVAERFGGGEVTFVGDRGMIKSKQIKDLASEEFHFITAITKTQIEKLLKRGIFQMSLFDEELAEVEDGLTRRYILRRNPERAREIQLNRSSKRVSLVKAVHNWNDYYAQHAKAKMETGFKALSEEKKLDGCYVLITDLPKTKASKELVHGCYKDLAHVEKAFRTSKMSFLELRPIHVRKGNHTRGHVFVVMLAYLLAKELEKFWVELDATIEEGLDKLSHLCSMEIYVKNKPQYQVIPEPMPQLQALLKAVNVTLPKTIRATGIRVTTRKKLPDRRKPLPKSTCGNTLNP